MEKAVTCAAMRGRESGEDEGLDACCEVRAACSEARTGMPPHLAKPVERDVSGHDMVSFCAWIATLCVVKSEEGRRCTQGVGGSRRRRKRLERRDQARGWRALVFQGVRCVFVCSFELGMERCAECRRVCASQVQPQSVVFCLQCTRNAFVKE